MDGLIKDYEVNLSEAGCTPGSARYGAVLSFAADISEVMPYLNAAIASPRYDHENGILIIRDSEQAYAIRPHEIRIARAGNWDEAQRVAAETVEMINRTWRERESLTPRYSERKMPAVIEIFKLLPKTNCKECGYPTCLAFAADLSQGKVFPENCTPLQKESREKILTLFAD